MSSMKCYSCGRLIGYEGGVHRIGCPEAKHEYLVPTHHPKPVLIAHADPPLPFKATHEVVKVVETEHCSFCRAMQEHKTIGDTVLPIKSYTMILGGYGSSIQAYPDTELKLLRLWVDEDIAPHFRIGGIMASNTTLFQSEVSMRGTLVGIPASHFTMANRENYHLATEWSATISPAQRVTMHVQNVSDEAREFRGLFECQTVRT